VRKVLGASFTNLWSLMTKDFLSLILIAIVISLPISWWLMSRWLDNFANRINMTWELFLIPAILLIFISILTVSYHTIKTALLNPAESLKDE
ncbi:MAG: FtsX-like permease family protein, partial [Bacteroidota bacterium]